MEKIYSKVDPSKLLHVVVRGDDFLPGRVNVVEDQEFLQCALLRLNKGVTFNPHKHLWKDVDRVFPQESWCVLSGSVKCVFYDTDDSIVAEPVIYPGDLSFSFGGGHNYLILEDDTKVAEYKVGPYLGVDKDKVFI